MYEPAPIHETGTLLKKTYEIQELLARGGMSRVYRATRPADGQVVAIKELFLGEMEPERLDQTLRQFEQEGALLQSLHHTSLVEVLDCFAESGRRYIVMQFLDGQTLGHGLAEGYPPAPVTTVLEWIDQVCDVLAYLHHRDPVVVLRDLHPGNIILAPDGVHVHVIDFGIAKAMDGKGTILRGAGTPGFAPIEQHGAGGIDQRADIYALGATLYALLTQQIPPASQARLFDDPLEPPAAVNPAIPPALSDLVIRLMSRRKQDRPESMDEVRTALKEIQAQLKHPAPAPPPAAAPPAAAARKAGCLSALLVLLGLALPRG